jgi:hypothetical protein
MESNSYARALAVVAIAVTALFGSACTKDDDGIVARAADKSKLGGTDREAADFVRSKVAEHWVAGDEGWTSQFQLRNVFGAVMPGEPDTKYHQFRKLDITVTPETVTESQKLNGADYRAVVNFERTSERFYRLVETYEGPRGWSLWRDGTPAMLVAVERRNGQWLISDTSLFDGIKPDPAEIPSGR